VRQEFRPRGSVHASLTDGEDRGRKRDLQERDNFLLGCDNNFPNTGRNPARADDNELIIVRVPGLKSLN
jgi:hypothetical protein